MTELRRLKFMATLVLVFKKLESDDKTKYDTFYSHSKAEIIISDSDIDDVFKSIYTTVISNIQKSLQKGSGLIIDSVIDHNISISKYLPWDIEILDWCPAVSILPHREKVPLKPWFATLLVMVSQ